MDDRLTVALVVLVALGSAGSAVAGGAVPVSSGPDAATDAAEGATATDSNESNGTAVGTEVSAFMESSSESANGSVDRGLFDAEYNGSNDTDRAGLVRDRTGELGSRLAELRAEKRALVENRENLSDVTYRARMSSIVTRIHELEAAINDTERKAVAAGVDTDRLDRLRNDTGNLTGPEVARVARNLSGVTPGPPPGAGPPNGTGPPDNSGLPDDTDRSGDGQGAPAGDDGTNGTQETDGTNDTSETGGAGGGTDADGASPDRTAPTRWSGVVIG